MASDPVDILEQQNGGEHGCLSPPVAPIIQGTDRESRLVAYIQERLDGVPPLRPECCIYRVPESIRKINEATYTPQFVSIGPFHHGKENLKVQETLKWQHLSSFVGRNPNVTLPQYVKTIEGIKKRICDCYAEIISVSDDEFVRMMLVDGCFILEYMFRIVEKEPPSTPWFKNAVLRDLILLENQLPLFVLEDLHKLNRSGNNLPDFTCMIRAFSFAFANTGEQEELMVQYCCSSTSCSSHRLPRDNNIGEGADSQILSTPVDMPEITAKRHLLDFVRDCFNLSSSSAANAPSSGNKVRHQRPQNATTLYKTGVKFEVRRGGKCLLDVTFENGVLAIPCIYIYDRTESLLRNMIAYEQLNCVDPPRYITDYAYLLDSLIDTSKDVELLHDHGIIKNWLGDHEEVSLLFNNLVKEVMVEHYDDCHFCHLCHDLKAYHRFWHAWVADLRQTYFNTPWTAISVIAAAVLIVLTILQTIFTIKSYTKQ